MDYRGVLSTVGLLMLGATSGLAVVAQSDRRPSNPMELAVALADARMPAGMILPATALGQYRPPVPAGSATADALSATIVAAAAGFATPLVAQRTGAVWLVQDPSTPADVLDKLHRRRNLPGPVRSTAAHAIFIRVVEMLQERKVSGVLGSGRQPDERCPLQQSIEVAGGPVSVVELLNQTVQQVPGVVWFVTYDSVPSAITVGIVCPGGQWFQMTGV